MQPIRTEEGLLAPGLVLGGKYRIERELGHGGMGIVYLATQLTLRRSVAVKLLPPVLAAQPAFVARFRREAETLARLRHPHIVSVTDYAEDGGHCYLVLDYIEGGTLEDYCKVRGETGLPAAEASRILEEILTGLSQAHRTSIIHRDLKPANILMEKTGEAKISDFGLARVVGDDFQRAQLERSNSIAHSQTTSAYVGTADFMSPEVKAGRTADARADLYAMGVITYWLLTGKRPSAMAAPVSRHFKNKDRRLSPLWDKLIARALAEDPDLRFATADEMLTAVREVKRSRPATRRFALPLALGALVFAGGLSTFLFLKSTPAPSPQDAAGPAAASASSDQAIPATPTTRTFQISGLPAGAELRVAGSTQRADSTGALSVALPAGEHPASIHAPGFTVWRGPIGTRGQQLTLVLPLTPLLPRPVKLIGLPAGARVTIADVVKTADADGTATFDLIPGSITVSAAAKHYHDFSADLALSDGATELSVSLEKIPPPVEVTVTLPGGLKLTTRRVEPGEFFAGSPPEEIGRQRSDDPITRTVIEAAFYLGVSEFTQAQFSALMSTNPSASRLLRDGNRPVEQVSWAQITQPETGCLARLNALLRDAKLPYRADLPTEREWEYACRAGTRTAFNNGSSANDAQVETKLATIAVFRRSETAPKPVGERPPNAWGFHDLHGNVAEWTSGSHSLPVLRGGHWRSPLSGVRSASRVEVSPETRPDDTMGFRIILRPIDE